MGMGRSNIRGLEHFQLFWVSWQMHEEESNRLAIGGILEINVMAKSNVRHQR